MVKLELDAHVSAADVYYIANHPDLDMMFDEGPPNIQHIQRALATPGVAVCLVKYGSVTVGFLALKVHDEHITEISGGFIDGYRGKVAKDVITRFIDLLFKAGSVMLVGEVLPDNRRCLAMAHVLGFKRTGYDPHKNRIKMSLMIGDWKNGSSFRN